MTFLEVLDTLSNLDGGALSISSTSQDTDKLLADYLHERQNNLIPAKFFYVDTIHDDGPV